MTAIVIDNGSSFCRAGFAGETKPKVIRPSIIDAKKSRPISGGIITNWDDVTAIWNDVLKTQLKVDLSEHPILITEGPSVPYYNREKIAQVMFEDYNVPSVAIVNTASLSLFAAGRVTGVVVDCGTTSTTATPVYEGFYIPHATVTGKFGGDAIDEEIVRLGAENGHSYTIAVARRIKEKIGRVSANPAAEASKPTDFEPGIVVTNEHYKAPELLFSAATDGGGLVELASRAAHGSWPSEFASGFCDNVILTGGTTAMEGVFKMFETKLKSKSSDLTAIRAADPQLAAWTGGSLLAHLDGFRNMVFTREEYDENGAIFAQRKCI